MTGRKLRLPVIFLALSIWSMALFAKKPEKHQQLEKLENEIEETIRYADMRVSKITGAPVALYRVNYPVKAASPEVMARQYLQENAVLLHINENLGNLSHTRTIETPGGLHIRFRQLVGGFPVYNSDIVVTLNRSETVTFVMSDYKPLAKLDNTVPAISIAEATRSAKAYLNIQGQIQFEKAETVVYHNAGKTRLAHKIVIVPAEDLFGDWELLVDAHSGDIFRVEDKAVYGGPTENVTGSGWVFDPDPLTHARVNYSGQFVDNNDANSDSLTAHTVQRDLLDIEFDGTNYHLRGPYAQIVDSESPFNGLFSQATNQWHNLRNASAFEAANVYYHLDASMRYINEELGFNLMPYQYSGGVKGDPHGLSGSDNSHYISSTGQLAWGEGGVDDSEDADVILHELGHGLHDWLTNGGLSQVNGLSEGCGDYWANSYNRSKNFWTPADPQYWWVFQWDGHNPFWGGRVTNYTATYPGGLVGSVHTDGQMWASTLMQIWDDIGRFATDSNFLEALAMTNSSTNQQDAAQAFVQADINLFGGANLTSIITHFTNRGYNITVPVPQITHTPLTDTEDLIGPYTVTGSISAANVLTSVQLIYGTNGSFTDTLDMNAVGSTYTANIPGTGSPATIQYYIRAIDALNLASTSPANAPANFHSFSTGSDVLAPEINHNPLGNQALLTWPATVSATVTDNLGIGSVVVEYVVNGGAMSGSFAITDAGGDLFSGAFDIPAGSLNFGDVVEYRIIATDASSQSNQSSDPASGYHSFEITDVLGLVLIIDDDPASAKLENISEKGTSVRDVAKHPFGVTANNMEGYLSAMGYLVSVETPATTDPATWGNYSMIISSSGLNQSPVSSATYRSALENWVSDPANKLLIEGGEVGYDAAQSPGYPTFAANVLHTNDWNADNAGPLNIVSSQENHPMVNTPNQIPSSMTIEYSDWGSEDAVNAVGGAYLLYGTTDHPTYAGISIYDDNTDPRSAQIVFFAFNFAELTDQNVAANLLENAVNYLLTSEENTQTFSMSLENSWNLMSLPMTMDDSNYQTLFPNAIQAPFYFDGSYQQSDDLIPGKGYWLRNGATESLPITGLPLESFEVQLDEGWNLVGSAFCDVPIGNIEDPGNIVIQPIYEFDGTYQTATQISTGKGYWIRASEAGNIIIACAGPAKIAPVAQLDLSGESRIAIADANGNGQSLYFNVAALSDKNATEMRMPPLPPAGLFDARFSGDYLAISGAEAQIELQASAWPLAVRAENLPVVSGEQFVLREMLGTTVVAEHPVQEGMEIVLTNPAVKRLAFGKITANLPTQFALEQNYPNPFNPTTEIRYALPQRSDVQLVIFNALGQQIRTLVSRTQDAGFHEIMWDGKDSNGQSVASGIYLYRIAAGNFSAVRKMILMK